MKTAYQIADELEERNAPYENDTANFIRQQQAEIDQLNYDLDGFKQNFFVSGFHLQIKMANEQLVKQQDEIEALKKRCLDEIFNRTYADRSAEVMCEYWELAQAEVDGLKVRIERMIEKASHHEALAHAGGFEAGRQQGMKQERALWKLAASTQEIEK